MMVAPQRVKRERSNSHHDISHRNVIILTRHEKIDCNSNQPDTYDETSNSWSDQYQYPGDNFNNTYNAHKSLSRERDHVHYSLCQILIPICQNVRKFIRTRYYWNESIRPRS